MLVRASATELSMSVCTGASVIFGLGGSVVTTVVISG